MDTNSKKRAPKTANLRNAGREERKEKLKLVGASLFRSGVKRGGINNTPRECLGRASLKQFGWEVWAGFAVVLNHTLLLASIEDVRPSLNPQILEAVSANYLSNLS